MDFKISDAELFVMNVLWDAERPLNMAEIRDRLTDMGWDHSTIKTLVRRLCHKGAILQEKREVFYFKPMITQREYGAEAARDLIDKLYQGSTTSLVAALVADTELTEEDAAELRSILYGKEKNG